VECGAWGKVETEPFKLAQETLDLLGDQGAGWSTSYASWVGYGTGGGSSSGGNLVTYRSTADKKVIDAADALTGAFNKVEISTIEIQTIQGGRQQGADSPWELAKKTPQRRSFLLAIIRCLTWPDGRIGPGPRSIFTKHARPSALRGIHAH